MPFGWSVTGNRNGTTPVPRAPDECRRAGPGRSASHQRIPPSDAAVVQALPAVPFRQDGQVAGPVVRQMASDDQSAATLPLFRLQPAVLERGTATNRARVESSTDDWCAAGERQRLDHPAVRTRPALPVKRPL